MKRLPLRCRLVSRACLPLRLSVGACEEIHVGMWSPDDSHPDCHYAGICLEPGITFAEES